MLKRCAEASEPALLRSELELASGAALVERPGRPGGRPVHSPMLHIIYCIIYVSSGLKYISGQSLYCLLLIFIFVLHTYTYMYACIFLCAHILITFWAYTHSKWGGWNCSRLSRGVGGSSVGVGVCVYIL
jgi:hypothetical protein